MACNESPVGTLLLALLALADCIARLHAAAAPEPAPRSISRFYDGFKRACVRMRASLDLAVGVRKLTGNPREAANVVQNDQVRLPSTWWTPTSASSRSLPDMLAGTGTPEMPPGTWTIVKAKNQGVSPVLPILDANAANGGRSSSTRRHCLS